MTNVADENVVYCGGPRVSSIWCLYFESVSSPPYIFVQVCFNVMPFSAFCLHPHLDSTVLSFAGRLYQVEYAMEAIGHAGTCLGILANDGVLLAAERRNIHKLLDEVFFSEKIYKLNE